MTVFEKMIPSWTVTVKAECQLRERTQPKRKRNVPKHTTTLGAAVPSDIKLMSEHEKIARASTYLCSALAVSLAMSQWRLASQNEKISEGKYPRERRHASVPLVSHPEQE